MTKIVQEFLLLLATIDPIGTLSIFVGVTATLTPQERTRAAFRSVAIAGVILLAFLVVGQLVLAGIGVPLESFQLAGSVLGITLATLLAANRIHRLIGDAGAQVIIRVMGILLCALATEMTIDGIEQISAAEPDVDGFYVFGHEVRTIRLCGTDDVLWVDGPAPVLRAMRDSHGELTAEPYDSVFVRVRGARTDTSSAGFAADYDGSFTVQELLEARMPRTDDCGGATAGVADN